MKCTICGIVEVSPICPVCKPCQNCMTDHSPEHAEYLQENGDEFREKDGVRCGFHSEPTDEEKRLDDIDRAKDMNAAMNQ